MAAGDRNWAGWSMGRGGRATGRSTARHTTTYIVVDPVLDSRGNETGQYKGSIDVYDVNKGSIVSHTEASGTLQSIRERAQNLGGNAEGHAASRARADWERNRGNAGHAGDGFDPTGMGGE